jgi:hypothetical protein
MVVNFKAKIGDLVNKRFRSAIAIYDKGGDTRALLRGAIEEHELRLEGLNLQL